MIFPCDRRENVRTRVGVLIRTGRFQMFGAWGIVHKDVALRRGAISAFLQPLCARYLSLGGFFSPLHSFLVT